MPVVSNVLGAVNFVAMLLSVPVIGAGVWLTMEPDNACVKILQWPVIILGILILVVALAGLVGGLWRIHWLLLFYLVAMLVLIALLLAMVLFAYFVTDKGMGHSVPGRVYLEYHLDDYSGWLRRRVEGPLKWERIKFCLSTSTMCAELNQSYHFAQDFFKTYLTPLQSGCCKPPTECGYTFVNPTYWISPISSAANKDCMEWSNEQTQLCYGCDSCKAGLIANLRREWRRADVILLCTLIGLVVVYLAGCCAFRNAKTEELFRRYKQGYS
ncbi:protein TORNADO 2 [Nymphaea colorata]|nr:protein TORNADO 2 [Nymphaea colorata]